MVWVFCCIPLGSGKQGGIYVDNVSVELPWQEFLTKIIIIREMRKKMRKVILIMSAVALALVMQAMVVQSSQAAPPASGPCGYGYHCNSYNYGYNNQHHVNYGYNRYRYNNYNNCNYRSTYYYNNYYKPYRYTNTCYNCYNRNYSNPHNGYYYYW